ncbi:hypothetical protein I6A60_18080 [Frankia sp. AgB1.9]|uniref:DUF7802 domain-containing protein n=1 Tax=unclassified Frankia TaxID=2632575 RepID=UPI00193468F0|nr:MULTISPECIES: hypothetical protein [unclassified Frankia]MBL7486856.1 hypothetical protein [Frankia sp. AgW1.1]MBL7549771.1 hypothetical protein [Frankia sp. AgB1.9]MBL7622919.1 hypothetical protein [Frankia sp. AgB1.8]
MAADCSPTFEHLARKIGSFSCASVEPVVHLRDPFGLANWTLPVVEALLIAGAVLALVHAVRRWRRHGDPSNLAVWFGAIVYLAVTEPTLFFSRSLGLPDTMHDLFAHNVFTVQLVDDRIPLYIVALYAALTSLAYEIVRSLGGFRRNVFLGAICVGFVHHLFYEIFDQLGPQLRWWIWNYDLSLNQPRLASVPMTSVFIFAALGPAALTLLARLFVGRRADRGERVGGWSLTWRTLASGVLVPPLIAVGSLPSSVVGDDNNGAQAVVMWLCVAAFAVVAVPVLYQQWRAARADRSASAPAAERPWFAVGYGSLFLVVFVVLWTTALPAYQSATDGVTADGTPIGSLPYAIGCLVAAAAVLAGVATASSLSWASRPSGAEVTEPAPQASSA